MSHWTVAKLRIKNPNLDLLKQALQVIAKELGVNQVVENYVVTGWGGRMRRCLYAIPMKLPYGNGYGIYIENGEVKVVVDDHGAPLSASEFANKLNQYYTALAIARVAPQLGFTIQSIQQLQQGVLIDLVR